MYSLDWPSPTGAPQATALLKQTPEDFQVDEFFDWTFSGEGEHIVLKIEKRGLNTEEVLKSLSRLINKPLKLLSYAGLKDRQALTTQWISIHAPGEQIEGIESLAAPGWRVLESTRHLKKLKPGFLKGNHFKITLREVSDPEDMIRRMEQVKLTGVPNYFGEQRFGRESGNLVHAEQLLVQGKRYKDRFLKGLYCSAARSWLFNLILAKRVNALNWNLPLIGDVMQLQGSKSVFVVDEVDETIQHRIATHDIAPASPLAGRRKPFAKDEALSVINAVYEEWAPWVAGLEQQGMEEDWRSNVLYPENLTYVVDGTNITLSFSLPAGSYATTVLSALVHLL